MPLLRSLCTALVLTLMLALQTARADPPRPVNVLVVTEDFDPDTIPRDNRIYDRVIAALQESLNVRGFQVYEETGVSMAITAPHQTRRRDEELFELASHIAPPMDAVVIFQIYASIQRGVTDIRYPKILITSRVLNVNTHKVIATFEIGGDTEFPPLPLGCNSRECLYDEVGKQARLIAADLGQVLADKMAAEIAVASGQSTVKPVTPPAAAAGQSAAMTQPDTTAPRAATCTSLPTAYELKFRDFSPEQINQLEEYLASFSCYSHHRISSSGRTYQNIWYETSLDSARMNRNLRVALDHIGIKGSIIQSGNYKFEILSSNTR